MAALEGTVSGNAEQSSDVQAIASYYGASNLTSILSQSTPHGLSVRVPALKLLLGDTPEKTEALAKLASPVFHVDKNDPPLLLLHGDQDPQMPINQAHELQGRYKELKLDVAFVPMAPPMVARCFTTPNATPWSKPSLIAHCGNN